MSGTGEDKTKAKLCSLEIEGKAGEMLMKSRGAGVMKRPRKEHSVPRMKWGC